MCLFHNARFLIKRHFVVFGFAVYLKTFFLNSLFFFFLFVPHTFFPSLSNINLYFDPSFVSFSLWSGQGSSSVPVKTFFDLQEKSVSTKIKIKTCLFLKPLISQN